MAKWEMDRRSIHFIVKVVDGNAVNAAADGYRNMVLKEDGSVWATGWNRFGQLGDGGTTDGTNYVQVVSGDPKAVAAGSSI